MEKASTEIELKVSNGRITNAEVLRDGTLKISVEMNTKSTNANGVFVSHKLPSVYETLGVCETAKLILEDELVLCEASKLSLDDEFMKHTPSSDAERKFKKSLEEAIMSGVKDFYRPVCDPSFDEAKNICYVSNAKPAMGKSPAWWNLAARKLCPERRSRLGKPVEYIAFLGILIKKLLNAGWGIDEAWNAVCNDSKKLGNYSNSSNAKFKLETTKSRNVCGFYDLANVSKILSPDEVSLFRNDCWIASGIFMHNGAFSPLSGIHYHNFFDFSKSFYAPPYCVGWLVFEK